jgi:hypothetical protein
MKILKESEESVTDLPDIFKIDVFHREVIPDLSFAANYVTRDEIKSLISNYKFKRLRETNFKR